MRTAFEFIIQPIAYAVYSTHYTEVFSFNKLYARTEHKTSAAISADEPRAFLPSQSFKRNEGPFLDNKEPSQVKNIQTLNAIKSNIIVKRDAASIRAKYEHICYCSPRQLKSTRKLPKLEELLALKKQDKISAEGHITLICYMAIENADTVAELFDRLHHMPQSPERTKLVEDYRHNSYLSKELMSCFKLLKPIVDKEWEKNPRRQGACCRMCILRDWQGHIDTLEAVQKRVGDAFMH